jgi:hypothetical protein
LAGFLREKTRVELAKTSPALRVLEIIVTDYRRRGLFVMNAEGAEIWWGEAPGDEPPGKPTAPQKWGFLCRWQDMTPARFLDQGDFWAFSQGGIHHVCPHRDPSHAPRAARAAGTSRPVLDGKQGGSG